MSKRNFLFSMIFTILMASGLAWGQEKSGTKPEVEKKQITGEVVDLGCFVGRSARGEEHKACAMRCLKNGNPAGIVDDNGNVYTIAASSPKYTEFASQSVRLTGVVKNMMIRPEKMEFKNGMKWKEVELSMGAPKQKK